MCSGRGVDLVGRVCHPRRFVSNEKKERRSKVHAARQGKKVPCIQQQLRVLCPALQEGLFPGLVLVLAFGLQPGVLSARNFANAGDIAPSTGDFRKSHKLRIGRYAQHFVDALSFDENPIEYLMNRFPEAGLKPEQMRAQLGRFGLSGHHHLQPICKLSGGQKARVVFTSIALTNPHILLLDEPTNHLDMQSIDALSDAIEQFEGGVIIISHDSQLLSQVCDDEERSEVWVVDNGEIERYEGYFEDYKAELVKEIHDELGDDE